MVPVLPLPSSLTLNPQPSTLNSDPYPPLPSSAGRARTSLLSHTLLAFTKGTGGAAGMLAVPGVAQASALPPGVLRRVATACTVAGPWRRSVPRGVPCYLPLIALAPAAARRA